MTPGQDALESLGRFIADEREEIERRWLARIQADVVGHAGLEPTQLRDGMPDYLASLADALINGRAPSDDVAESAWCRVAREHGITRVRYGFDIGQLVHEFVVLRRVITELRDERYAVGESPDGFLAGMLEAAIRISVQSYVEARDFAARRTEAQNIGFLTHELRHPLQAALLSSNHLRRRLSAQDARDLDGIDRALQKLAELIDGVLLTERLEAGAADVERKDTTLGALMEPVEGLRPLAEQKHLGFRVTYDPDAHVTIDRALTQSAIQNVAENAIKYTEAGDVDVRVAFEGDELVVDVQDACDGLSPEELATIFQPFKRGHTRTSGAGLGLAIAKRAVEAQGGSIAAESAEGAGCRFTLHVPARRR